MIDWKHPEYAVELAKKLKEKEYPFHLTFVGQGEMRLELEDMVAKYDLTKNVTFMDFVTPTEVRSKMEEADIYLMTSDRKEGWGAVVNEAMNAGCVVIASHMVGATPNLICHEENGLVFCSDKVTSLVEETEKVINNKRYRKEIGMKAYETVANLWNPQVAANRLLEFCETKNMAVFEEGPCSKEVPIRETKMYRKLTEK
jgi:glycosyltransferase involved in cell wall biosynthesis